jgi:hypothetical protein
MVWKEHHFARELERQLVEIASIRKRMDHDPEVAERLDRLELSHRHLIRKLAMLSEARRSRNGGGEEKLARALRVFHSVVHDNLLDLVAHVRTERSARSPEPSSLVQLTPSTRASRARLPCLDERCARCGKVLLSSMLGGADLVHRGARWYHRECAPRGRKFTRPGPLN